MSRRLAVCRRSRHAFGVVERNSGPGVGDNICFWRILRHLAGGYDRALCLICGGIHTARFDQLTGPDGKLRTGPDGRLACGAYIPRCPHCGMKAAGVVRPNHITA